MQGYDSVLKHFVSGQVPEFVASDHPMFVAFMEAYFEWLQTQEEGRRLSPLTLLDQRDIDNSLSSFVSLFREEYLKNFPKELAFDQTTGAVLDERKLMKHIRSFYKAKGTEKAYKFLFTILYNTYAEIYYPKTDILRLSDGKWNTLYKMKVTSRNGRKLFQYNGGTISQRDSAGKLRAYATIKDIIQYTQNGYEVTELVLQGLFGSFAANEQADIQVSGYESVIETIYTILTGFEICDTGETTFPQRWNLYRIGDSVTLVPTKAYGFAEGGGAKAEIAEIDYINSPFFSKTGESDARGPARKFRVLDTGVNYNPSDWKAVVRSEIGRGLRVTPVFGAVLTDYGYYVNDDGHPSSKKKLQDNYFYQDFSYVVKTEESFDRWVETIKKLIHPAGMAVFAQQYLYRISGYRVDDRTFVLTYEDPIIGHYTPYRVKTYENLRNNSAGIDLYPEGYNPSIGPAIEWGQVPHDPAGNPLSEGLIQGVHNVWCLPQDHNLTDEEQIFTNNITGGCTGTEELQAKHEVWEGCTGTGPGCCLSAPYWIIYSHPNSRGYTNIPLSGCYNSNGTLVPAFTRFGCIVLNDFFHMEDGRYFHTFTPDINKFDGFEADDFVPEEAQYASPSGVPRGVIPLGGPTAGDAETNNASGQTGASTSTTTQ